MRKFVLRLILIFSLTALSAQDSPALGDGFPIEEGQPAAEEPAKKSTAEKSLFFTLGPKLMLSTDDSTKSAPSPVVYSLGVGGDFVLADLFLLQAHGSFFMNYYLWDGERARPAEVEGRTATALSLMLDLTGGLTFRLGAAKRHLLSPALGIGFLARYAILSNGVASGDLNSGTGSTAGDDVSSINRSFYSGLKFLYPQVALTYSYALSDTWRIGGEARAYVPVGSLIMDGDTDGMIVSLSLKFSRK